MTLSEHTNALPELSIETLGHARFSAGKLDAAALAAMSIRALEQHAAAQSGAADARLVSVSNDVTGKVFSGGEGEIKSHIDRQTRTLLFMGAELSSAAGLNLRSTAIFRLDAG